VLCSNAKQVVRCGASYTDVDEADLCGRLMPSTATPTCSPWRTANHRENTHCFYQRKKLYNRTSMSDPITENLIEPLGDFFKESYRFLNKCQKPDKKEFTKIAVAISVGFLLMGFLGFFIKLIHIPINQIIVGA
jgi:protein transport protein SEC61 subunit gamma and related proteins